jgi:hypothetical protein
LGKKVFYFFDEDSEVISFLFTDIVSVIFFMLLFNQEPGNIITNSWAVPSTMVAVEDESLPGGGYELQSLIYNAANEIIQEWTGQKSFPTSVYGIRVYKDGAILVSSISTRYCSVSY